MNELATPFVTRPDLEPVRGKARALNRMAYMQAGVSMNITPEQPSGHKYTMLGLGENNAKKST